jgi:nucleotide-binding universal stress UspA family protein
MSVVVGYDGSPASDDALMVAAEEAHLRGLGLTVLTAWQLPSMDLGMGTGVGAVYDPDLPAALADGAEQSARRAADRAAGTHEGLAVSVAVVTDSPASALVEAARSADLVVVGSHGHGGVADFLLGGVSRQVATHGRCPVVVARGQRGGRGAVVGIDGSERATRALDFAFEECSLRGWPLEVVHSWDVSVIGYDYDEASYPAGGIFDEVRDAETRLSAELLAGHRERYPDVAVTVRIARGAAADVLLEAARTADLLVVGSRGRGGFAALILGSVSHRVIHHAHCPVAVVH